jgi:hypothetical protein
MSGSLKNRLHDYEASWLTLLPKPRAARATELREAQKRGTHTAIDDMNALPERRATSPCC